MDVLGSSDLNWFSYLPLRNLRVLDLGFSFYACLVDVFSQLLGIGHNFRQEY